MPVGAELGGRAPATQAVPGGMLVAAPAPPARGAPAPGVSYGAFEPAVNQLSAGAQIQAGGNKLFVGGLLPSVADYVCSNSKLERICF